MITEIFDSTSIYMIATHTVAKTSRFSEMYRKLPETYLILTILTSITDILDSVICIGIVNSR
jgi:hypothetical protein